MVGVRRTVPGEEGGQPPAIPSFCGCCFGLGERNGAGGGNGCDNGGCCCLGCLGGNDGNGVSGAVLGILVLVLLLRTVQSGDDAGGKGGVGSVLVLVLVVREEERLTLRLTDEEDGVIMVVVGAVAAAGRGD